MSAKRENEFKQYVAVRADHGLDGDIKPRIINVVDEDGSSKNLKIDQIIDMREAPSLKAGGQGMRYICRIGELRITLFHDDAYWFIER